MISDMTILELLDQLNDIDEHNELEAKSQKMDTVRSLLETVCSLSNEPGLGGGTILLGVAESDASDGPRYVLDNVDDPDKAQLDLATQCKCVFNHPVFPEIRVEKAEGKTVLRIAVDELPPTQKPLYFKTDGLPRGAYRRVGSSDLRCTNEDIGELFADPSESYDQTPIKGATLDDVDEAAVRRYCDLRRQVNPVAEELSYDTQELLEALNCVNPDDKHQLNLSGVLLFGSSKLQRRVIPMARVGRFAEFGLSDNQKTALVFMREAGAINNPTYRQICGCDTLKASIELRKLRDCGVIRQKGRGTATYYIPSWRAEAGARTNQSMDDSGPSMDDSGPSMDDSGPSMDDSNPKALDGDAKICAIAQGAGKHKNRVELETIIWKMCSVRALERGEIATFLRRTDRHVRCILKSMVQKKILAYKYSEMIKHPHQAYTAVKTTMDSEV